MNVQNVYNISNNGTVYFPGAAQGMQCGDYSDMSYMSLFHNRNDRRNAGDEENSDFAHYELLETDVDVAENESKQLKLYKE